MHRSEGATQRGICPLISGLHNVPSVQSFPFVKQDRAICRRYMRTVYYQNGEQVSRTVLTLRFQLVCHGPPGRWYGSRLGSDLSV